MKRVFALLLCAVLLCTMLPTTAFAAEDTTAAVMRLEKYEGTVTVKNASGKKVTLKENMRLYNNYEVSTDRKSYAYISLDDSKALKLDASSKVVISRQGRKLEILVEKGKLFFDVDRPLEKEEKLDIRTSTMITGVRGTIGWVEIIDATRSQLHLLEGSTLVTTVNPGGGSTETTSVTSGQVLQSSLQQTDGEETIEVTLQDMKEDDIPGFVRTAVAEDPGIQERIEENTNLNIEEIVESAEEVLAQEEQLAEEETRQAEEALEEIVTETVDPLFESGEEPIVGQEQQPDIKTYTVTFEMNGHGTAIEPLTLAYGSLVRQPEAPAAVGFTFGGWYKDAECTDAWNFAKDTVTEDVTLYAKWTDISYVVTFEMNGHGEGVEPQTVAHGSMVTEPEAPAAVGFTFGGWYKDAECTDAWNFAKDTVTEDVTLYAKWTVISYTVEFAMNGFGEAVEAQNIAHGSLVKEPAVPTAEGYTFGGWYKDMDCTEVWSFDADTVTADLTLYAKWTINIYEVTFEMNGHGEAVEAQSVEHGGLVTEPEIPAVSDDGYTFGGWYKDAEFTEKWDFAGGVTGELVLYARWTEIPATTVLDNPTEDELIAALEESAASEFISEVEVINADLILTQVITVAENETLTVTSGSVTVNNGIVISGTMIVAANARISSLGDVDILSTDGLHINGGFENIGSLSVGENAAAGAVSIGENGTLVNSGEIIVDTTAESRIENNGKIENTGSFSVSSAGFFTNNGNYEEMRTDGVYAYSAGENNEVAYLGLVSQMTQWTDAQTISLHGAGTGTLDEALMTVSGVSVTLELNGFTLALPADGILNIEEGASLTVVDSSGGGKLTGSSYYTIENSGSFTLESGTLENTYSSGDAIYIQGNSTTTINGGSVVGTDEAITTNQLSGDSSTVIINGGYIYGPAAAVNKIYGGGSLHICGGELVSEETVVVANGAYLDGRGTIVEGNAVLRATTQNGLLFDRDYDFTLTSCILMAVSTDVLDSVDKELPQECIAENGYYSVDLTDTTVESNIWTLEQPTESELLRVFEKDYVTVLTVTNPVITLSASFEIPETMTVEVNGGQVDVAYGVTATVYGTLNLTGGSIYSNGGTLNLYGVMSVPADCQLINNEGLVQIGGADYGDAALECIGDVTNSGTIQMNSGSMKIEGTLTNNNMIVVGEDSASEAATLELPAGCKVSTTGAVGVDIPTIVVLAGGTLLSSADIDGQMIDSNGVVVISGGEISGESDVLVNAGTMVIEGGTITAGSTAVYNMGALSITDATVRSEGDGILHESAESLSITNAVVAAAVCGVRVLSGEVIVGENAFVAGGVTELSNIDGVINATLSRGNENAGLAIGILCQSPDAAVNVSDAWVIGGYHGIYNDGNLTVDGSTVVGGAKTCTLSSAGEDISLVNNNGVTYRGIDNNAAATVTDSRIVGGDVGIGCGEMGSGNCTLTISGGTVVGENYGIYAWEGTGSLSISDAQIGKTTMTLDGVPDTTVTSVTGCFLLTETEEAVEITASSVYGTSTAVTNQTGSTLVVTDCTLAGDKTGVFNNGTLTISGGSVSAQGDGGNFPGYAFENSTDGILRIHETVSFNVPETLDAPISNSNQAIWVMEAASMVEILEMLNQRYLTGVEATGAGAALTLDTAAEIPDGKTLEILGSGSVTVNADLTVNGELTIAETYELENNASITVGETDGNTASDAALHYSKAFTNNGIFLDYTYQSDTKGSYVMVTRIDTTEIMIYCGPANGTGWYLTDGESYTARFRMADEADLYLPGGIFEGSTGITLALESEMQGTEHYRVTLIPVGGKVTVTGDSALSFGEESALQDSYDPTQELFLFKGQINCEAGATLTACNTVFEYGGTDAVISITGDADAAGAGENLMLTCCTVKQTGSGAALSLTGAGGYMNVAESTDGSLLGNEIVSSGIGVQMNGTSSLMGSYLNITAADTGVSIVNESGSTDGAALSMDHLTVTADGIGLSVGSGITVNLYESSITSSESAGVHLYSGSLLEATGLTVTAVTTGVVVESDASAILTGSDITSDATGVDISSSASLELYGSTVTSNKSAGISNRGNLTLGLSDEDQAACTVSGATYALYNEGAVSSLYSSNRFILTSADGQFTVYSSIQANSDGDRSVILYGYFAALAEDKIFSELLTALTSGSPPDAVLNGDGTTTYSYVLSENA